MVSWNTIPQSLTARPPNRKAGYWPLFWLALCLFLLARLSSYFSLGWGVGVRGGLYTASVIIASLAAAKVKFSGDDTKSTTNISSLHKKLLAIGFSEVNEPLMQAKDVAVEDRRITPPRKSVIPPASALSDGSGYPSQVLTIAGSQGLSPHRGVTTPVQLQRVLDEFETDISGLQGIGAPDAVTSMTPSQFPSATYLQGTPTGGTYRPSARAKKSVATSSWPDGRLSPSLPAQRSSLLSSLGMHEEVLQVATERLREWFSIYVLQPLLASIEECHIEVVASAAEAGVTGVQLTPLKQLATGQSLRIGDDSLTVAQIRNYVETALKQSNFPVSREKLINCAKSSLKYQKLLILLHGEFPAGLLPPTPHGYIYKRIQDLANGSCMMDFLWDSGGNWNNSSWSADLPTDSALLLYLFAAYVAAPQWLFHDDNDSKIEGPEGTLYLGKIPSRIAGHYLAITSTRVSSGAKVSGIVGLHLTSQQPYFSLYRSGEVILTESGQNGLFTILILFIKMFLRNGYNFHLLHLHEILELTANF